MKRNASIAALGIVMSIAALWWAAHGIRWRELAAVVTDTPVWLFPLMMGVYLLSFVPRALRLRSMLDGTGAPVPVVKAAGEAQVLGFAANNLLPLRMGEIVRVVALKRLAGVPPVIGLSSLVAERILDGAIIVLVLGGSVAWLGANGAAAASTDLLQTLLFTGGALFTTAVLGLFVLAFARNWLTSACKRFLPARLSGAAAGILAAVSFLRDPRKSLQILWLSLLIWAMEGAVFVLAACCTGIPSPVMAGALMLAVVNLGVLLPSAPGYVGVFQACGILALQVVGQPRETGLAVSLVIHASQYLPITLLGIISVLRHGWSLRAMAESSQAT
jgi:uncharacterized protein (TIRG00374 family)